MSVCLFLHIPKTAGTTLKHCLYDEYAVESWHPHPWFTDGLYYFPYGFFKAKRPVYTRAAREVLARNDLRVVTGHFWYGIDRFVPGASFYLTLLRDPVDRVVSLYHHVLKFDHVPLHAELHARGASLEEFVTDFRCREADNDQTRRIAGVEPPFGEVDEAMLERAKRNLSERFAFVGVTERFDESLVAMKRRLGWEHVAYLPALVNHDRPASSSLPPETIAAIVERNRHDLALYEHATRLLDEAIAAEGDDFEAELAELRVRNADHVARNGHLANAG